MTQSFSFGFGSDDMEEMEEMEENGDEVVEVKIAPSHHTSENNRPVAVMAPKLHRLQDLV